MDETLRPQLSKEFFKYLNNIGPEITAPEVARTVHAKLKEAVNNPDPYKKEKDHSNKFMIELSSELKNKIQNSQDPLDTAMRLAVGGNIIDYGPTSSFDIGSTLESVLQKPLAIDHSKTLRQQLPLADSVLYLGDNTGEIILDKFFLEYINHPNVTFAVRDKPILNDVTMEDALLVGIDKLATVISNGDDAPSTLLHRTSQEFNEQFEKADLIISKGMGNFEGLLRASHDNLFFMLIVKCEHIANLLGIKNGDFVILHSKQLKKKFGKVYH
jgi:uncharacterized protein with ATP-grasp and redox domains